MLQQEQDLDNIVEIRRRMLLPQGVEVPARPIALTTSFIKISEGDLENILIIKTRFSYILDEIKYVEQYLTRIGKKLMQNTFTTEKKQKLAEAIINRATILTGIHRDLKALFNRIRTTRRFSEYQLAEIVPLSTGVNDRVPRNRFGIHGLRIRDEDLESIQTIKAQFHIQLENINTLAIDVNAISIIIDSDGFTPETKQHLAETVESYGLRATSIFDDLTNLFGRIINILEPPIAHSRTIQGGRKRRKGRKRRTTKRRTTKRRRL